MDENLQGAVTAILCVAFGAGLWHVAVTRPHLRWLEEDNLHLLDLVTRLAARVDAVAPAPPPAAAAPSPGELAAPKAAP